MTARRCDGCTHWIRYGVSADCDDYFDTPDAVAAAILAEPWGTCSRESKPDTPMSTSGYYAALRTRAEFYCAAYERPAVTRPCRYARCDRPAESSRSVCLAHGTCTVDGCARERGTAEGLCQVHQQRKRKHGDVLTVLTVSTWTITPYRDPVTGRVVTAREGS